MSILDRFKKEKEGVEKESVAKKVTAPVKDTSAKKPAVKKEKPAMAIRLASKKVASIILGPVVSEKTAQLSDKNVLVLRVANHANRIEVRNAFRELYKITPVSVNMMNVRGKRVQFGRIHGKRSDYKKALITLPKGTRVDIFEGV